MCTLRLKHIQTFTGSHNNIVFLLKKVPETHYHHHVQILGHCYKTQLLQIIADVALCICWSTDVVKDVKRH